MITEKKIKLYTEVCDDDSSRQKGLMYRKYLGENQGMLFSFSSEHNYSFWMKDTYIPLDIAFIDRTGKIVDIKELFPLSTRAVTSSYPCKYALEVNRGWFDDNHLRVGSYLWKDIKTSSADEVNVALMTDFKTAVDLAYQKGYQMQIIYKFKPVIYVKGKPVQRDGSKPPINNYTIMSSKLPNGRPFEYEDKGNGEYIVVPCANSSGEPRCFFIDGIAEWKFYFNGKVFSDPREIEPAGRKKPRIRMDRNPALEGIQSVPF